MAAMVNSDPVWNANSFYDDVLADWEATMGNERNDAARLQREANWDAMQRRGMTLDAATGAPSNVTRAHRTRDLPVSNVTCNACVTLEGRVSALEAQVAALQSVTPVTSVTPRSAGAARVAAHRARGKG